MAEIIPNPDVLVGCDALVEINGLKIAYAKSVELEENVNQRPVEAIGNWKPLGHKSVKWEGRVSMELHILTRGEGGTLHLDTSSPVAASQPYEFTFYRKSTMQLVASALGQIDQRSWGLQTNELSGQRVQFVLYDIEYDAGYN